MHTANCQSDCSHQLFVATDLQVLDLVETWFCEVCRRTAQLVASWQSVGFVHGVLNTDNMSITGLTLDYGPYGFMDRCVFW
jgi:uncharacterized protein YdiU (UPF0061 family)